MIKIVGLMVLAGLLFVSVLRSIGMMEGDFIIPLILLSQLLITGYLYNILQIISRDVLIRYNKSVSSISYNKEKWN